MSSHPPRLKPRPRRLGAPPECRYTPDEFVERVLGLEGRHIRAVHYYDNCITRGCDHEYWDRYGDLCDIIHAVEWVLDDGEVFTLQSDTVDSHYTGVTWVSKDVPDFRGLLAENFSILETADSREHDIGDVWDVSHHSRWTGVLRVPMTAVRLYFGPSLIDGLPLADACIMDLALEFANGRSITIAGNACNVYGQTLHRRGDEVVMAFGEGAARALGVGAFATPAWLEHSDLAPGLHQGTDSPGLAPTLSRENEDR